MVSISEVDTMSDSWRLYIQPWCNSCPNSSIGAVLDCSTETARSTSSCMSRSSFSRLSIFSIVNLATSEAVPAIVDAEHRLDRGMLDLREVLHVLDLRVNDAILVLEEGWQIAAADVAVLIYGGGEHDAAVTLVPRWIVRSSAKERDAERGASDDHRDFESI